MSREPVTPAAKSTPDQKSRRPVTRDQTFDPAVERIIDLVSAAGAVPRAMLLHHSRCRAPIADKRQLAMYLAHVALGRTMSEVGSYFGRDRTTVAHACGRVEDRRDECDFDAFVTRLEALLDASEAKHDQRAAHALEIAHV